MNTFYPLDSDDLQSIMEFFYWLKCIRDSGDTLGDTLEPNNNLKISSDKIKENLR
jgi:hypothetical protein